MGRLNPRTEALILDKAGNLYGATQYGGDLSCGFGHGCGVVLLEHSPDVTLMDLDLPAEAALGAIRKVRARNSGARIIGLSTYEPDATWEKALAAGVCQCVAKDRLSDSLPRLIRETFRN